MTLTTSRKSCLDELLLASLETVYNGRLDKILESLRRMGSRYYFRLNTLAGDDSETLEDMRSHCLEVSVHETVREAAFLPVTEAKLEAGGLSIEADRFAAEAVWQGAHLYAAGVRKCHGVRAGMTVTVVDEQGVPVGKGLVRQSETSILRYRQGLAVEILSSRYRLPGFMETPWYKDGLIHLQSLPAMVTCRVLDPKPDEVIVDLNCAPGGKMSHLCQLTGNKARIVGFDRNEEKIAKTQRHLIRLRCENYQLIPQDSRYAHLDYSIKADRVLVDPPCTGLGVMPKLSIGSSMDEVRNLSCYQRQFLTAAAGLVKKGGTIVYSVCTITGEECEAVVAFAEEKLQLEKVEALPLIGRRGMDLEGLTQRFDPELDGAGYFIARFVKP